MYISCGERSQSASSCFCYLIAKIEIGNGQQNVLAYYGRGFAVVYASSLVDSYKDRSIEEGDNHNCLGINHNDNAVP